MNYRKLRGVTKIQKILSLKIHFEFLELLVVPLRGFDFALSFTKTRKKEIAIKKHVLMLETKV